VGYMLTYSGGSEFLSQTFKRLSEILPDVFGKELFLNNKS